MVASSLWTTAGAVGSALRRTMLDLSGTAPADPFAQRRADLARLRGYYANELYRGTAWQAYRREYKLPRAIDGAFNPTTRAVDFYAGRLFDGAWTEDGRPLPDGTPHMVQFPQDLLTERPELVAAAIQFLDWSDWQNAAGYYVTEGAMVGTAVLELAEQLPDPATATAGRAWLDVVPLERVAAAALDSRGFLTEYAIEYATAGADGKPFRYRKEVDKFAIRTFRDDRPDALGHPEGPERENPYGFVPAWWVKHKNLGGLWGAPVIDGVIPKIDRLNALASGAHGFVNKFTRQPLFFEADSDPTGIDFGLSADDEDPADRLLWLRGPVGSKAHWLMQPMPLGDARQAMMDVLEEIHRDLPEVLADERLRDMSQITAPGARAAMGDVRSRFRRAQRQYYRGLEYAIKAGVAVAGWRLSRGDWGRGAALTRQQQKFAGFDLDSYARGDLDLAIEKPDLFTESELERLQAAEVRKRVYDLSAAHMRRAAGIFAGTDAEVAKANADMEAELAAELERSGAALAAL